MKKQSLRWTLLLSVLWFAISCGGTKYAQTDSKSERMLKGQWTLTDYSVEGIQENYVSLSSIFSVADIKCFKGSTWNFVPNNATATYQLNGAASCPSTTYEIKWQIVDENSLEYLQFKYRFEDLKDKRNMVGYRMLVRSLSETDMQLAQEIPFEGKRINLIYNFTKNN